MTMSRRYAESLFRFLLGLFTLAIFLASYKAQAQQGALTAPADLSTLVQMSRTIVRGHVVSAVIEPHPQFPSLTTVRVTISVSHVLKGEANSIFTFRQFVWDAQDSATAVEYHKSSELLLLLNPNSEYGLTSPVGLEQGRFRIVRDARGNAVALNGRGNAGLFAQLGTKASEQKATLTVRAQALSAKQVGPVPLDALEDAISAFVGVQR